MYFVKHKGFFFTFLGLICHFRDLSMGLGLGRVWDGSGTGLGRDWDGSGTGLGRDWYIGQNTSQKIV